MDDPGRPNTDTIPSIALEDINPEQCERIEAKARESGARIVGRIRHDPLVTRAQIQGLAVVDTDCPSADDIRAVWAELGLQ